MFFLVPIIKKLRRFNITDLTEACPEVIAYVLLDALMQLVCPLQAASEYIRTIYNVL